MHHMKVNSTYCYDNKCKNCKSILQSKFQYNYGCCDFERGKEKIHTYLFSCKSTEPVDKLFVLLSFLSIKIIMSLYLLYRYSSLL